MPFLTPGLPFIPTVAITVNIYLIFKLSILTLVRFTVWMSLGLIMYFYYGITHSSLENPSEEFELTVENGNGQVGKTSKSSKSKRGKEQKPAWDCHGYENRMATNDDGELHYGGAPSGNSWNEPSNGGGAWGDTSPYDPPPQSQVQFDISPVQPVQPPPNRPEIKKDGFGMFYQESSGQPYPTWED